MTKPVKIITERFLLRELSVTDVTERYLDWFGDADTKKFIAAAVKTTKLSDLKEYVQERVNREDILFLGIFDKSSGMHIGNIKYEPVDFVKGYAVMGILIGDPEFRSKGVTTEVLKASAYWLKENRNIKQILLGVSKDNTAAIKAYEKLGFVLCKTELIPVDPSIGSAMILDLTTTEII